jgi:hypothetical protein
VSAKKVSLLSQLTVTVSLYLPRTKQWAAGSPAVDTATRTMPMTLTTKSRLMTASSVP